MINEQSDVAAALRSFVRAEAVRALNVAGSRQGEEPGIYQFTAEIQRHSANRRGYLALGLSRMSRRQKIARAIFNPTEGAAERNHADACDRIRCCVEY